MRSGTRTLASTDTRPADAQLLERRLRAVYDSIAPFTVGAEEEFLLVDPDTHGLSPLSASLLAESDGDERVVGELREAQIESVTPICVSAAGVERELASVRRALGEKLRRRGWLVAAGTHPLAESPGRISPGRRYQELAACNPWAERFALTCGLHVHVAVSGADRALAVYNALRSYLPELVALGANAPYYRGDDSGLATVRPKLNACWPRSGVPPAFGSWRDVAEFAIWARNGGACPDASQHWWDLRLSDHGTIEVRAADVQTRVEDSTAIVALVQSLVHSLAERYDAGEQLPVEAGERISENMWLATRDGLEGWLIDLPTGRRVATADRLNGRAIELFHSGLALGCTDELADVTTLVAVGGGAAGQRTIVEALSIDALIPALAEATAPDQIVEAPKEGVVHWLHDRDRTAPALSQSVALT
jgi:glutamate---cysteine ligase / carboxylate-amine ligase